MSPEDLYKRIRAEQERLKKALAKPLDIAEMGKQAIRQQAAEGARSAVMPWIALSIALSLYALSNKRRRR